MSVARSSLVFSIGTFFSRISGVVRESVIGAVFGASAAMDAFNVAFRIPNLLRDLLAEGALGSSFTKVFTQVHEKNPDEARRLFWEAMTLLFVITSLISVVGIFLSQDLVRLISNYGDDASKQNLFSSTVFLTRVMFPYIAIASLGAVTLGVLYQRNKFFLAAVSPIAFNVMSVIGALIFSKLFIAFAPDSWRQSVGDVGILGLAVGVLIGGILQFLTQLLPILRDMLSGGGIHRKLLPISKNFSQIMWLMAPMVVATSAGQINVVINTNFATELEVGAVSWLNYAFRILQLPVGMFGVAIGAAVLPTLVRSLASTKADRMQDASKHLFDAILLVLWLTIPCLLLMAFSSEPIIAILFQAGRFKSFDTQMTASALQAYSGAVIGYGLIKVLTSFYYSVDRTRYAMIISLISIVVNYVSNSLLVHRIGFRGLAFTSTLTLSLNALLLFAGVFSSGVHFELNQYRKNIQSLITALILGVAGLWLFEIKIWPYFNASFPISESAVMIKLISLTHLVMVSAFIVALFGVLGLNSIKLTPKEAFKRLRRRKPS